MPNPATNSESTANDNSAQDSPPTLFSTASPRLNPSCSGAEGKARNSLLAPVAAILASSADEIGSSIWNDSVVGFQITGFSQWTMLSRPPISLPPVNAVLMPTNPPTVARIASTTKGTHIDFGDSCGTCGCFSCLPGA